MSQVASKQNAYRWIFLGIFGLLCAYIWSTSVPLKVYFLVIRGLRRHGFEIKLKVQNRRVLIEGDPSSGKPLFMSTGQTQLVIGFGEPMYRYFVSRDKDSDGHLDPSEFHEFSRLLAPIAIPYPKASHSTTDAGSKTDVNIVTNFIPLKIESLTKIFDEKFAGNTGYFRPLLKWIKPHRKHSKISTENLVHLFWPESARNQTVGEAFYIMRGRDKATQIDDDMPDSNNRYFLPTVFTHHREKVMSYLLGAFHQRAFPRTRNTPTGSAGVVRAINKDFIQIYFRLHAVFQLSEPPDYPFWFTPSYFLGQITFTRDLSQTVSFYLDIPKEKTLNVDMEWLQQSDARNPFSSTAEVDIGYIPKMELKMTNGKDVSSQQWEKEISNKKAFDIVERKLYNFKLIDYLPFGEAFIRAEAEKKLVHSVILWGSLDDQSC